jgi:hypothetical protein
VQLAPDQLMGHEHTPVPVVPSLHVPPFWQLHTPLHEAPQKPVLHAVHVALAQFPVHEHAPVPKVPSLHVPPFWHAHELVHVAP